MFKKSATYFLGNLLASLIGFGGLMLITRLIAPSEFGVFTYIISLGLMIYPLLFTWLRLAVLRDQSSSRSLDLRTTILSALLLIMPVVFLAISLAYFFKVDLKGYGLYLGLMIFFTGSYEIILEYIRAQQLEKRYFLVVVSRSLLYISTALFCFYTLENHAFGLIIAYCTAYLVAILIGLVAFIKKPAAPIEKQRIKEWIKASPAPTVIALFATLIMVSDRFFINYYLDIAALGQYAASSDLTKQLVLMPAAAFTSIFMNKAIEIYHNQSDVEFQSFMQKSLSLLLAIMLPVVFGLILIGADAAKILIGEKYSIVSSQIIPFLALGIFFNVLSNYYFHAIYHAKKLYKPIIYQLILSLILNSLFLFLFIKPFGLKGAAIAFMCSEGLGAILSYILSRKQISITFVNEDTVQIIAINMLLAAVLYLLTLLDNQSIFKVISIILIYALCYFVFIIKKNLFNARELIQAAIKRL